MPEKIKENKGKIVSVIGAVCLAAGAVLLILWLLGIAAIKAAFSPVQCILAVVIGALVLRLGRLMPKSEKTRKTELNTQNAPASSEAGALLLPHSCACRALYAMKLSISSRSMP